MTNNFDDKKQRTANSTYPKVAVQWLNQALCFYQSLCLVDSEVLLNRHLRVAEKRYLQAYPNPFHRRNFTKKLSKNLNYSNFILTKSNNKQ